MWVIRWEMGEKRGEFIHLSTTETCIILVLSLTKVQKGISSLFPLYLSTIRQLYTIDYNPTKRGLSFIVYSTIEPLLVRHVQKWFCHAFNAWGIWMSIRFVLQTNLGSCFYTPILLLSIKVHSIYLYSCFVHKQMLRERILMDCLDHDIV